MGARRNDITVSQRVQIARTLLNPARQPGRIKQLKQKYGLSRQSLYSLAQKGEEGLRA